MATNTQTNAIVAALQNAANRNGFDFVASMTEAVGAKGLSRAEAEGIVAQSGIDTKGRSQMITLAIGCMVYPRDVVAARTEIAAELEQAKDVVSNKAHVLLAAVKRMLDGMKRDDAVKGAIIAAKRATEVEQARAKVLRAAEALTSLVDGLNLDAKQRTAFLKAVETINRSASAPA